MKRIGIVGGVGWQSTVEYYTGLCRLSEERRTREKPRDNALTPEMCIESLDLNTAFRLLGRDEDEESWRAFDDYHRTALQRLQASDAEVAVIASNTPHHRYASIVRGIGIPVLGILDAAAAEGGRMGATQVLVLGTALTMQSPMFPQAFAHRGIEAAAPRAEHARASTVDLIADLHHGKITGAAERISAIATAVMQEQFPNGAALCLACTELPLAFPEARTLPSFERGGIAYINTTAAHIRALFDFAVS